ncbi:Hachiman antiphage defense system protein HamA [Paenibacillus alvei]|uniref:Anti-bacteriophage protein A/HamA C-terminal domain-containing protein n=1 Tax=Paenibacillus alvei TaxID=44250 RepID=A0A383R3N9_PAEAL|nr:Hachiman antiphage defense system protein HamA [Paenibacillus alvei]SYX81745.1 conserved protein of unknown function [Paenibacillus alvei]
MEWEKIVQIDNLWIDNHLINQHFDEEIKVKVRGYSIKFSGNVLDYNALSKFIAGSIHKFVYSSQQIRELGDIGAFMQAQKYFGKKNPSTDGKYGELLLFMLVEGVLKCPMVAHKIVTLSNSRDQVKGGDGIFLGNYEYQQGKYHPACLIGESKIMDQFSVCVDDALDSLDRFHNERTAAQFSSTEFMVAKQNISEDFDIDYVYDSLTPGSEAFQQNIMVHPIFLMYNTNEINTIEREALTQKMAESLMKDYFEERGIEHLELIKKKITRWSNLQKVFLDFFIIPVNNVQKFRNTVYYQIHGVEYES